MKRVIKLRAMGGSGKTATNAVLLADFIARGQRAQEEVNCQIENARTKTPRLDRASKPRLQGIAAAFAELSRAHKEPDLAAMVLNGLGLSVSDLKSAGADAYDLEALKVE